MLEIAPGWELELERGPDWLFVRLSCRGRALGDEPPVAERVWQQAEQHFTYRIVLELDRLGVLSSFLIGQLILLQKRACTRGGVLRLCGLSADNLSALQTCRLDNHLPVYANREAAVMGRWQPAQPR